MPLLHVSMLLDFTAAAAAEELRSRWNEHAKSAAAAEVALVARREERTRLAGVYEGRYINQSIPSKFTSALGCCTFELYWCFGVVVACCCFVLHKVYKCVFYDCLDVGYHCRDLYSSTPHASAPCFPAIGFHIWTFLVFLELFYRNTKDLFGQKIVQICVCFCCC